MKTKLSIFLLALALTLGASAHGKQKVYIVQWNGCCGAGGSVAIAFDSRDKAEKWVHRETSLPGHPEYDGIPWQFGITSYTIEEVEVR